MNIPEEIIGQQPENVRHQFLFWAEYMEKNITFGKYDSDIHTYVHCERVLLYSLIMGSKIFGDNDNYLEVLSHASIFHDTRRLDDFLDKGHGARAACYYKDYCKDNDITFHSDSYNLMKFHDQDDKLGEEMILKEPEFDGNDSVMLYRIFKDADALDRFRLGPWGLNPDFLRNREALELMDFAKNLVEATTDKDYYNEIMEKTRLFKDRISKGI